MVENKITGDSQGDAGNIVAILREAESNGKLDVVKQ